MYIPNRHHPFWHLFLGFGSLVANGHVRLGIFDGSFQIYSFLRLQNCNSVEEFCANFLNLLGFITSAVGNGREGGGEQGVTATLFLLYVLPPPLLPPTPAFRLPPPIELKKKKKKDQKPGFLLSCAKMHQSQPFSGVELFRGRGEEKASTHYAI